MLQCFVRLMRTFITPLTVLFFLQECRSEYVFAPGNRGSGAVLQISPDPDPVISDPMSPPAAQLGVTLHRQGLGRGRVDWLEGAQSCLQDNAETCVFSAVRGSKMTLVAEPAEDSLFTGFQIPGCAADQLRCVLTLSENLQIKTPFLAEPEVKLVKLTLKRTGNGGGVVVADNGFECFRAGATTCVITLRKDSPLRLTAQSDENSFFDGFQNAPASCPVNDATCSFTVSKSLEMWADFEPAQVVTLNYQLAMFTEMPVIRPDKGEISCAQGRCLVKTASSSNKLSLEFLRPRTGSLFFAQFSNSDKKSLPDNTCVSNKNKPGDYVCSLDVSTWGKNFNVTFLNKASCVSKTLLIPGEVAKQYLCQDTFHQAAGLWADGEEAWVVGANAMILHFDGKTWVAQNTYDEQINFTAIWGSSGSDIWAVGHYVPTAFVSPVIVHYDGQTWSYYKDNSLFSSISGIRLHAIHGTRKDRIWIAGDKGTLLKYDGTSWSKVSQGQTTENLLGIWVNADASALLDVWAVGAKNTLLYRAQSSGNWYKLDVSLGTPMQDLKSVWGESSDRVWAVGSQGYFLEYDRQGGQFTQKTYNAFKPSLSDKAVSLLTDIAGNFQTTQPTQPKAAFMVGAAGTLLQYDGARWVNMPTLSPFTYFSRVFVSGTQAWVLGLDGSLLKVNLANGVISEIQHTLPISHAALWGSSARDVWALGVIPRVNSSLPLGGQYCAFLHYDGEQWRASEAIRSRNKCTAMWGYDARHVWADIGGRVYQYDGAAWSMRSDVRPFNIDSSDLDLKIWGLPPTSQDPASASLWVATPDKLMSFKNGKWANDSLSVLVPNDFSKLSIQEGGALDADHAWMVATNYQDKTSTNSALYTYDRYYNKWIGSSLPLRYASSIFALTPSYAFIGGLNQVLSYDIKSIPAGWTPGTSITPAMPPPELIVNSLWGSAPTNMWAVSNLGLFRNNSAMGKWERFFETKRYRMLKIWGQDDSAWIVSRDTFFNQEGVIHRLFNFQ